MRITAWSDTRHGCDCDYLVIINGHPFSVTIIREVDDTIGYIKFYDFVLVGEREISLIEEQIIYGDIKIVELPTGCGGIFINRESNIAYAILLETKEFLKTHAAEACAGQHR